MDNEKNLGSMGGESEKESSKDRTTRARNKTVMLTPEITGQVRARLAEEMSRPSSSLTPTDTDDFVPLQGIGNTLIPGLEAPPSMSRSYQAEQPATSTSVGRQANPQGDHVRWIKESRIVGFLVSFDSNENGDVFELRSGRLIVTSESTNSGNCLVIQDSTVSPMHAIVRVTNAGEVQVLDQLSENGTSIRRFGSSEEEELSGEKGTLEHGDVIKFGNRSFHVCMIASE